MKLTIMNYDIDTDIEKNYQELSDKLSFLGSSVKCVDACRVERIALT